MSTFKRLTEVFDSAHEIAFNDSDKIILFSDCHRGDGSWSDEFDDNQDIFFHALNYYFKQGYTYNEVGDGEELWENRRFEVIRETYSHIYWRMRRFKVSSTPALPSDAGLKKERLFLIWGNHNRKWKSVEKVRKNLYDYKEEGRREHPAEDPAEDPIDDPVDDPSQTTNSSRWPLFGDIRVHEGLRLKHSPTNKTIFVTHGHQGCLFNDSLWWLGRYVVRHLWRPLQFTGFHDPSSPAKSNWKKGRVEKHIQEWAEAKNQMIIAGHTHRPWFPKEKEPPYFNCGSCVHPRCITGIEIRKGNIALIKWSFSVNVNDKGDEGMPLVITRECMKKAALIDCIP